MENLTYYAFCALAIVVGIWLLKRFVGCLIRTVITLIVLGLVAYVYIMYIM